MNKNQDWGDRQRLDLGRRREYVIIGIIADILQLYCLAASNYAVVMWQSWAHVNVFSFARTCQFVSTSAKASLYQCTGFYSASSPFRVNAQCDNIFNANNEKTEAIVYVCCALDLISLDQHIIIGSEYVSKVRPGSYM